MKQTDLLTAFQVPRGITAAVGGGGKTGLLLALGKGLAAAGRERVLLLTSTHILAPDICPALIDPTPQQVEDAFEALARQGRPLLLAAGCQAKDGRLGPLAQPWPRADYLLVEADGSRMLPLKAPAAHEPVIPPDTRLVIGVAGISGVGRPIAACAHRPELYAALCGKAVEAEAAPEDVARVLWSRQGQRKGVGCDYMPFINQADSPQRLADARQAAALLPRAVVGAIRKDYYESWGD